jgi:CheY-like chemotaxis protein
MEEFYSLKCTLAFNGKEAINIIEDRKCCSFSLIFMDCMMPIMDGYEATRLIKSMNVIKDKNLLIVGLSAMTGEKEIERWFTDGIDYFCKHTVHL